MAHTSRRPVQRMAASRLAIVQLAVTALMAGLLAVACDPRRLTH
jgi:hypothetical protein